MLVGNNVFYKYFKELYYQFLHNSTYLKIVTFDAYKIYYYLIKCNNPSSGILNQILEGGRCP